ncbi:MAG: ARMT1-like domain-containing protein [Smithellaceae bacterium]|nr:ARMT1-like domain-containing protein [Smithellaceae bacterium]
MKSSIDCIPCFVRQAADAVRMTVPADEDRMRLMRAVLEWMGDIDLDSSPPASVQMIHRRLRGLLPAGDPYREAKDRQNDLAARLIPSIRKRIAESFDSLTMAVRYAITGNILDLGAKNNLGIGDIYAELQSAPIQPIFGDMAAFQKAVSKARQVLYLADNAGEIFFDRLLIEQLAGVKVTLAVRGMPVINDATREDALAAGIDNIAEIIDNGSDAPGTILSDCNAEFRKHFDEADLIIAKGQGNFETLSDAPRDIFFLFRTKCPVISLHSGFCIGTYVATNHFAGGDESRKRGLS